MNTNELDVYEREAGNWWEPHSKMSLLNSFNEPRFMYFSNFIKDWKGLKVLDVGCGGGFTSEYLCNKGAVVQGIDISGKLIETAIHHAAKNFMEINYHQGIAENLPFEDDLFDVVVCVDVLEHVSDLGKTIAEAKRVLKTNGAFLFDTINKTDESKMTMITLMEDTLKIIPKGGHDWDKFIEPEKLKDFLINAGFSEIEFKGFQVKGQNAETGRLEVEINDDLSVVYIGKANG